MSETTVNDKYRIVNTLYSDQNQSVYYVTNSLSASPDNLIMNEIKDKKIVAQLIAVFMDNNEALKNSFVEFFFKDSKFYVVSKVAPGETLGNIILKTNLDEADKMRIAAGFLRELAKLEQLPLSIQHVLCNFGNISVVDNEAVFFNHFLSFNKEDFQAAQEDIIRKAGDILAAIYMNTLYFRPEEMSSLPEEVTGIINRCLKKEYQSTEQIYSDFVNSVRMRSEQTESDGLERLFQRNRVFLNRREKKERTRRKGRKYFEYLLAAVIIVIMGLAGVTLGRLF